MITRDRLGRFARNPGGPQSKFVLGSSKRLDYDVKVVGEKGKEVYFVTGKLKDHEGLNWLEKNLIGDKRVEMTISTVGKNKYYMNRTDASGGKGFGSEARNHIMNKLSEKQGATFSTYIESRNISAIGLVKDWKKVKSTGSGAYYEKVVRKK